MKSHLSVALAAACALLATVCLPMSAAKATTVTETYDFNATFPAGAAFSTWDGSFTITFDPTVAGGPSALDAFSSNLPASYGTFEFIYGGAGGGLAIGDKCAPDHCTATSGTDTAWLSIFPVTASGGLTFANASLASTSTAPFFSTGGSLTPTPLPAALPLFATGLGGLALLGWRRKRKAQAA
jgi:hypothetical protein